MWGVNVIDKIEINMVNGTVHNFKKGEFGVESIEIDNVRGFIEINYGEHEMGSRRVIIPIQNIEKCEFIEKSGSHGQADVGGYVG